MSAPDPGCPFCAIASAHPPCLPSSTTPYNSPASSESSSGTSISADPGTAFVLLSTPLILAFLDHAPITRGHVLIVTRQHRGKLDEVTIEEGRALGAWMGVLSRTVVGSVQLGTQYLDTRENGQCSVTDWNIVNNNGLAPAMCLSQVWETCGSPRILTTRRGTCCTGGSTHSFPHHSTPGRCTRSSRPKLDYIRARSEGRVGRR